MVENSMAAGAQEAYDRAHIGSQWQDWTNDPSCIAPVFEDFIAAKDMEEDFLDLMFGGPVDIYEAVRSGMDCQTWQQKIFDFVTKFREEDFTQYMAEQARSQEEA